MRVLELHGPQLEQDEAQRVNVRLTWRRRHSAFQLRSHVLLRAPLRPVSYAAEDGNAEIAVFHVKSLPRHENILRLYVVMDHLVFMHISEAFDQFYRNF